MSNELRHATVGTSLTQAEFEDVALHIFNSQATGDILYASSTTQLTRLGIGAANTVLVVSGGIPSWSATLAGLTLTAPVINGTVTTTGLTLPAFILGGALNVNGQVLNSVGEIYGQAAYGALYINSSPFGASGVPIIFRTTGVTPGFAATARLDIGANAATAVATWTAITHTGTVITNAASIDAANGADGNYFTFGARDSDTDAIVEVARVFGAADPYFAMGGSQQFKFYNSGIADFGSGALTNVNIDSGTIDGTTITIGAAIISNFAGVALHRDVDDSYLSIEGGNDGNGATMLFAGKSYASSPGKFNLYTPNTALALTSRLVITGGVDTATVTWANVNHNFGAGTITTGGSACVASFGPAGVTSITVKNGLITAIS